MRSSFRQRFLRPRLFLPAVLLAGLTIFFWPARELGSDNFVFYFPSGHHLLPFETVGGVKYLPLLQVLNLVGKVGGIQEKKNSYKIWFGSTQIELRPNSSKVQVDRTGFDLPQPVHVSPDGQWMVPVDFLTTVLPRLSHQAVEYQEGTNRIFVGDTKPASFTVRVDAISSGARLTIQFTDKVAVQTASSNGKWVMFLGDRPMEPLEPSYHFQNPYLSELQYDDQDGVPKLILSPTSNGLNFYPVEAEGGKILLADVVKPPSAGQAAPPPTPLPPSPPGAPGTEPTPLPQVTEESPAAPPGPPLPIIALDAGHGGDDNGGRSHDGVLEKNLTAQYVARVRTALLTSAKFRVVLTRTGDVNLTSDQRALVANLSGAVCFLSFHAGDLGTASPRIAVFTYQPPTPAGDITQEAFVPWGQVQEARLGQSLQLALALQQQFQLMGGVESDLPATAPVRTLRSINAPAVAIELGRLSPDEDATTLVNPALQQQVATAVLQGLASFVDKGGN